MDEDGNTTLAEMTSVCRWLADERNPAAVKTKVINSALKTATARAFHEEVRTEELFMGELVEAVRIIGASSLKVSFKGEQSEWTRGEPKKGSQKVDL